MNENTRHPLSRILPKTPVGPMRSPARALGWFSIGLGVAELLMPRALARLAGAPNVAPVTRLYGLREIGVGAGLLMSSDPAPWLWGRVAGDALDMATVTLGLVTARKPGRTLTTLAVLATVAYLDMKCAEGAEPKQSRFPVRDYSARSGFPRPAAEMRGAARRRLTPKPPSQTSTSTQEEEQAQTTHARAASI